LGVGGIPAEQPRGGVREVVGETDVPALGGGTVVEVRFVHVPPPKPHGTSVEEATLTPIATDCFIEGTQTLRGA
jgi:hypothetical protein